MSLVGVFRGDAVVSGSVKNRSGLPTLSIDGFSRRTKRGVIKEDVLAVLPQQRASKQRRPHSTTQTATSALSGFTRVLSVRARASKLARRRRCYLLDFGNRADANRDCDAAARLVVEVRDARAARRVRHKTRRLPGESGPYTQRRVRSIEPQHGRVEAPTPDAPARCRSLIKQGRRGRKERDQIGQAESSARGRTPIAFGGLDDLACRADVLGIASR